MKGNILMKKKISALAAAVVIALSLTACDLINSPDSDSGSSGSISDNSRSSTDNSSSSASSDPDSNSSGSGAAVTEPLTVRCGDIFIENEKRVFDVETVCGNAFSVIFHYISTDNRRIENAIPSFRPLGITDLKEILNDPHVGGSALSVSDFEFVDGVYKMKDEELARSLLGSLASTYSFDQYWKNQKMAELVSAEGISAEEARPRVDEMFEKMENNIV